MMAFDGFSLVQVKKKGQVLSFASLVLEKGKT